MKEVTMYRKEEEGLLKGERKRRRKRGEVKWLHEVSAENEGIKGLLQFDERRKREGIDFVVEAVELE